MREKATSARLPAFSINSRQSSTTSGLRRVMTPAAPITKMNADRTRNQTTCTSGRLQGSYAHLERLGWRLGRLAPPGERVALFGQRPDLLEAATAAGEHHRAHGRHQQQVGGGLERHQEARQEQLADLARRAEGRPQVAAAGVDRLEAARDEGDAELDTDRHRE